MARHSISDSGQAVSRMSREDLITLTKARLSFLVIATTLVGYLLASKGDVDWVRLLHTLFGSSLAALGAGVFNQLMEIEEDGQMRRTADRPLPTGRIPPVLAFGLGWLLAAFGLVHLAVKVNFPACYLTALTLLVYLFVYTPMKRRSSWNTIVGAVSGAVPPLIGWVAGGGDYGIQAAFLFGLLFLWQMPHFLAINWMFREDYIRAGFVMWSNDDDSGKKTASLALLFSLALTALMALPWLSGAAGLSFFAAGSALSLAMVWLSWRFLAAPGRACARRLFFYTLMYLPAVLLFLLATWK